MRKYTNYQPQDAVGKILQNRHDYDYLSHVSPESIPPSIKKFWRTVDIIGFILFVLWLAS